MTYRKDLHECHARLSRRRSPSLQLDMASKPRVYALSIDELHTYGSEQDELLGPLAAGESPGDGVLPFHHHGPGVVSTLCYFCGAGVSSHTQTWGAVQDIPSAPV